MNLRTLFALLVAFALAASLAAQTKISGTLQCGKADPSTASLWVTGPAMRL